MLLQHANLFRNTGAIQEKPLDQVIDSSTSQVKSQEECSRALHIVDSAPAPGWTTHATKEGRLYYCNHITRTAGWLPPVDVWKCGKEALPYGWERAVDDTGKSYYINHVNKTTTYETPVYRNPENLPKPKPRTLVLERSTNLGFGFVAGSEKPVIVRFVTEGGPSANKLLPGDQILSVNGEDVKLAPREHVISLVRSCTQNVTLEVCQPAEQQGIRKSTLLSANKRARLKSKPSRVRFAESVCVNGAPLFPPSAFALGDVCVPQMANVLKVFLENGQTKSFKYDTWTTVQDVVNSLQAKMCIQASEYFSLVVEHIKSLKRNKLTLLDPQDSIARIASQPGAHKLRCLFRVTFVPTTAASLAQKDLNALDYLFNQCCNDVIQERFSPELQYDTALRLAALHMYHHALANNMQANKLTVKVVEKEFGLERFVPASILENLKRKEIRKLLGHFLKLHSNMTGSGKQLTSLQVKLHYLDITSQLPSYGAKCFSAGPKGDSMEKVILVSPKFGISQIMGHRNSVFQPIPLATLDSMCKIEVRTEDEVTSLVFITLNDDKILEITLDEKDALELVLVLRGYFKLLTNQDLKVDQEKPKDPEDMAPSYLAQHKVIPEKWSYVEQEQIKAASFTSPPIYQNVNRKTNGLYNTVGRHSKQSLLINYDLDGNMNSSMSNRNHKLENGVNMGGADFYETTKSNISTAQPFFTHDPHLANRLTFSSEWQETSVDFDSDAEEGGKLKHSDSLTLLNKIHKDESNYADDSLKQIQSESDNDSLYTPHSSPKSTKEENGLSFGLRSPNNLDNRNQEFQEYLRRICNLGNKSEILDEIFVFDPDIIDLTNIPPPLTPDELDSALPTSLSVPPRPFADSMDKLNALDLNENQDLEEFLASVSVPPPTQKVTPAMELTPEEIMAYIIPPPPDKLDFGEDEEDNSRATSLPPLVKNKSTLHDVLVHKNNSLTRFKDDEVVKPLPRRKSDEQPPERPPKEFLKDRKGSYSSPTELPLTFDPYLPVPQLPPRQTSPTSPLPRPALPPKKPFLPQLPLVSSLNDDCNERAREATTNARKLSDDGDRKERILKGVDTAVATPMTTFVGKPAPIAFYTDEVSVDNQKDTKSSQKVTESKPNQQNSPNLEQLLSKTDSALVDLMGRVKQASAKCLGRIQNSDTSLLEKNLQKTKDELTTQSLQLVTSSKQLVIAMSEPTLPDFLENLAVCLTILRRLTELCQDLVTNTTSAPLQTRNLITNIHDLLDTFRNFVTSDIDRSSPVTVENHLALHAEVLANVLSTLLRHLKVFPS